MHCTPPCVVNTVEPIPGQLPPSTATGSDAALVTAEVTADPTPGEWVELLPEDAARNGAAIQNKDAAAIVYFVESETEPTAGSQPGEIGVPVFPGYYNFDWAPKKRYWVRSTVAGSEISVVTW